MCLWSVQETLSARKFQFAVFKGTNQLLDGGMALTGIMDK